MSLLYPWKELPEFMKVDAVEPYYFILAKKQWQLVIKRLFDLIISSVLILLLLPLLLIIAFIIKFDSAGPIFYRQIRVTQYGKTFKIYKFRTMENNADKTGILVTLKNDKRITRVGSFLRKYRLDEIPQLFNILKGEMTIVGTRPEVPKYVNFYTDEMYATLLLPAGVTSKASICYKDESELLKMEAISDNIYIDKILQLKMALNLEYLKSFSIINDIKIIFLTMLKVWK